MHDDDNVYGQQTFVSGIKSDTIDERTGAAGVTIDTVLIKDGLVDGIDVSDLATGWIAGTTWTYATASTFTVAGDLTTTFQKGTKLKFTQATVKYAVVIGSAYGAPNTTVTIAVNIDYVIANAAITSPYYSYIENPQGYPIWFNYTPTWDCTGAMTYTSISLGVARFEVQGKTCHVVLVATGTTGGTASFGIQATLPITNAGVISPNLPFAEGVKDGTTYINVGTGALGATQLSFRKHDSSVWGLSSGRVVVGDAWYEI